jgi:hypothetical protein
LLLSRLSKIRVGDTGVNTVPESGSGVAACAGTTTLSAPAAATTATVKNLAADNMYLHPW